MYRQTNQFLTVNWHFVNSCNMSCRFCFVPPAVETSLSDSLVILQKLRTHFDRINFVGGEPTSTSKLKPLVKEAKSLGFQVSIVSNGYNLIKRPEEFDYLFDSLSCIGLSIDSLNPHVNLLCGRHVHTDTISEDEFYMLSKRIKEADIRLKINTVVNKLNVKEDLNRFYEKMNPDRIKLFQVLKPDFLCLKHSYDDLLITKEEFASFVFRHKKFENIICSEDNEAMTNSYYMLNAEGKFIDNGNGLYSESILYAEKEDALSQIQVDEEKYFARYA